MKNPIDNIQWIPATDLTANNYNPNHVYGDEMKLLELNLVRVGWIQPILVSLELEIIDGFHRATLARVSGQVKALAAPDHPAGTVPCAILDLSAAERMLLTVRINRAKGSHLALKMHELVRQLHHDHGLNKDYIARGIGATMDEVDLLLQENVFKALDIDNHQYSKAWVPK